MEFLLLNSILAQAQPPGYVIPQLPPGPELSQGGILGILISFANFLIAAGVILAIIAIVVSGVMYLKAGGVEANITKAKGWFKNGIIGAFIILGVGVIIITIYNIVVTGSFFGGLPGGGGVPGGGIAGGPGASCPSGSGSQCAAGTVCDSNGNICVRAQGGNLQGEGCTSNLQCKTGLTCKGGGLFGTGQKTCQP